VPVNKSQLAVKKLRKIFQSFPSQAAPSSFPAAPEAEPPGLAGSNSLTVRLFTGRRLSTP